jgi:3-hydroxyisobutyrate dehydrogenase-like beta-hydroxyacid dehydrogenase
MPMGLSHRIAIIGAGLIGSALAGHLIPGGSSGPGDSQRRSRVVRRGLP